MKKLKKVTLLVPGILLIVLTTAGCQTEPVENERDLQANTPQQTIPEYIDYLTKDELGRTVLMTSDLSSLFIKDKDGGESPASGDCPDISSGEGFPINGCKDFTVGVSLAGWIYVETTVTVCCACAVCGINLKNEGSGDIENLTTITIRESSSILFDEYEISIANGTYEVGENGDLLEPKFKVVVR